MKTDGKRHDGNGEPRVQSDWRNESAIWIAKLDLILETLRVQLVEPAARRTG